MKRNSSVQNKINGSRLVAIIRDDFADRRARNSSFSVSSYARLLKVNRSTLSRVMNGKISVSKRMGESILSRIQKDNPRRATQMKELLQAAQPKKSNYVDIGQKQFAVLSEWHHFAIFSLSETDDFVSDKKWIAKRLSISEQKVEAALKTLVDINLLKIEENGRIVSTGQSIQTTDQIINLALRKYNRQMMHLADQCLAEMDEELFKQTDFSGMVMAIDPARLPEARRRIRNFRKRLADFLESGAKKTEVYKVFFSLFPLSSR